MNTVVFGETGRRTTRLGFGCGSVMGVLGWNDSMRMLETAFDAGIRHFDVAPAYGYGEAERCLGAFLSRHPGQVTVTTKFGISPANRSSVKGIARRFARPVLKALPGLKRCLPGLASAVAHQETYVHGPNPIFTAEQARRSIETSLLALRVEHLDLLLLHEARAIDLGDDALLEILEDMVVAGKLGSFGIGSEESKIASLLQEKPAYCTVLQHEWSVMRSVPPRDGRFRVLHRTLTREFGLLHASLLRDVDRRERWSEACGRDVSETGVLAALLLKGAMLCNPESVVLFSSKNPENIRRNARVAEDADLEEAARLFHIAVQEEQKGSRELPWISAASS